MDTSEIRTRIKTLITHYGYNPASFERASKLNRNAIRNTIDGKNLPGYETLSRILDSCPEINAEWLLRGSGAMLKNDESLPESVATKVPAPPAVFNPLETLPVTAQSATPIKNTAKKANLKSVPAFKSALNLEAEPVQVPVLSEGFASAGLGSYQPGQAITEHPTVPIAGLARGKTYAAIRTDGNSMQPTLADGTWLIISPWQERYFNAGSIFVVFDRSRDQAFVKRVRRHPTNDALTLLSDNPAHAPMDISGHDLGQIWKVELALQTIFLPPENPTQITQADLDEIRQEIKKLEARLPQ
jgi:phage repressor protein C with HTH and peptisase S24 domain